MKNYNILNFSLPLQTIGLGYRFVVSFIGQPFMNFGNWYGCNSVFLAGLNRRSSEGVFSAG